MTEQSKGHIAFVPTTHGDRWEFWEREGSIWRQVESAPVMPDGYRSGRWYAYAKPEVVELLRKSTRKLGLGEGLDGLLAARLASVEEQQ